MTTPRKWPARAAMLGRAGALALCLLGWGAAVAQDAPARTALKVCQDPNNMPFSNTAGEGIENRIAEVFGKALGLPVTYYSFPQRLAFIRNTLRYKLPEADYPCDIVMGVPAGYDQVSVTKPYYRSTYALVFAPTKGLENVRSPEDFLKLDRTLLSKLKIGVYDRSPASDWLVKHGLVDSGVPYQIMNADPKQYPGEIIERELAAGKLDAAIVWGPIAGYYAKRVSSPKLTVLPLRSERGVKFDFEMAMGVRYGEPEWKKQVETLLETQKGEIAAILKDFGVPVVDESYSAAKP